MPRTSYVGIDVACAKKKRLPLAVWVHPAGHLKTIPLRDWSARPPSRAVANSDCLNWDTSRTESRIAPVQGTCLYWVVEYSGMSQSLLLASLKPRVQRIDLDLAGGSKWRRKFQKKSGLNLVRSFGIGFKRILPLSSCER